MPDPNVRPSVPHPSDEQIATALAAAAEMARRTHELDLEGQPYATVQVLYESRQVFERAMEEMGLA